MTSDRRISTEPDALVPLAKILANAGIDYDTGLGWTRAGVAGHRLQIIRRGGRIFTTAAWLIKFLDECNR